MSSNDTTGGAAPRRPGFTGTLRWPAPWAYYVLFLAVGRVLTGDHAVRVDELAFGMPLAWLAAWATARGLRAAAGGTVLVALAGLLVGLLA